MYSLDFISAAMALAATHHDNRMPLGLRLFDETFDGLMAPPEPQSDIDEDAGEHTTPRIDWSAE